MTPAEYWFDRGRRNRRFGPFVNHWMGAWNAQPDLQRFWKQPNVGFDRSTQNYLRAQGCFERGFRTCAGLPFNAGYNN